jgi:hypothetical protein
VLRDSKLFAERDGREATLSSADSNPRSERARSFEPWISLALLAALTVLAFARSRPPSAKPIDAPGAEFSAERARSVLTRLIGPGPESPSSSDEKPTALASTDGRSTALASTDGRSTALASTDGRSLAFASSGGIPHAVGTAAHDRVLARLADEMRSAGLAPEFQEALVAGPHANVALVRNAMARIVGRESAHAVMLAAHYDSVPAGPGAGDDGAGVATELEIARILTPGPRLAHDVIFLFTDGEELGLLGARAFCAEHPWAKEVAVAVNVEGRGTCGPSEMFETSEDNAALIELFARAVPRPSATSLAYEVYKRMPNDTDMSVFKRAGMAGFNFAFIGGVRRYHTPLDDLAHLDPASLQQHGDNALALVRALADAELPLSAGTAAPRRDVFQDVLGFGLLRWPERLAIPIALAELLLLAFAAIAGRRSGALRWSDGLRGASFWIVLTLASGAIALAVQSGLLRVAGDPEPWTARDAQMAIAVVSAVVGTAALAAILASAAFRASIGAVGRAAFLAAWLGAWVAIAALGVAVSIAVPGASPLLALPTLAASLCAWPLVLRPAFTETLLGRIAQWIPTAAMTIVWIPLAIGLERAVGFQAAPALGTTIGATLACAAIAWLRAPPRRLLALASVGAITSLAFSVAIAFGAPGSVDEPMHLNLARVVDADKREERWLAASSGWPLPAELAARGALDHVGANPYPAWARDLTVHESTPRATRDPVDEIEPDVRVASRDSGASGREMHLLIRSRRGARALVVDAPMGVVIRSVALLGRRVTVTPGSTVGILGAGTGEVDVALLDCSRDSPISEGGQIEIDDSMPLDRDEGAALLEARPATWVPRGEGDVSIVVRRIALRP